MSSTAACQLVLAAMATYAMHSTLLLLLVWGIDVSRRVRSIVLRERLWKSAAMIPLLTAAVQVCWTGARPVWEWQLEQQGGESATRVVFSDGQETDQSKLPQSGAKPLDPVSTAGESIELPADDRSMENTSAIVAVTNNNAGSVMDRELIRLPAVPDDDSQVRTIRTSQPVVDQTWNVTGSFLAPQESSGPAHVIRIQWIALVAVVVAALWGLLLLAIRVDRLRRCLQQSTTVYQGRVWERLREVSQQRGLKNQPRLLMSVELDGPSAVGLMRPAVIFPKGLEDQLNDGELDTVLAHEVAHLVRRDPLWIWIGETLRLCLWWQPLNLLAARRWRLLAEFQCDSWAVGDRQQDRIALARVLTMVLEWQAGAMRGTVSGAAGPGVSQRIALLLDGPPADRWRRGWRRGVAECAVILMLASVAVFGPRMSQTGFAGVGEAASEVVEEPRLEAVTNSATVAPAGNDRAIALRKMRNEFRALTGDLEVALKLLAALQDDDEELEQMAEDIRSRIESLRFRVNHEQVP